MDPKISEKISKMSFILCIFMVLYHIGWNGNYDGVNSPSSINDTISYFLFHFIKSIGEIVTPAFGVISGFLFFFGILSIKQIYIKMKRRVKTLLIPYFLWNILGTIWVCLPYVIIKGKNKEEFFSNYDWVESIIHWGGMPHFWYIFMLIFFTLIAPCLYLIVKNKSMAIALLVITFVYIIYKNETLLSSRFVYICFIWGGLLATYNDNIMRKINFLILKLKSISKWVFYLSFVICWFIFYVNTIRLLDIALEIILIILLYFIIDFLKFNIHQWMLMTFWVYAVHYYLDGFILRIFYNIIPRVGFWTILNQLLTFFISVTIAFSSGIICKKYIPKVYTILCGERGSANLINNKTNN